MILKPDFIEKTAIVCSNIVGPSDIVTWLNLSSSVISFQEDMINELIKTAIEQIELYTWLCLRRTTYEAYFEVYELQKFLCGDLGLALERSPIIDLDDITTIEYLNSSGTWTEFDRGTKTIDGLYTNTTEIRTRNKWASLYFINEPDYDTRDYAYKIKVTFTAGFDPDATDDAYKIPRSLKTAIKMIVAFLYTNRGDCDSTCSINGMPVPCGAKMLLDRYSIALTALGG